VWISDLISIAFICSQPIAYSYSYVFIVKSVFYFSKSLPSDTSIFGCATPFNLSTINVPASINSYRFQAPPAVGQSLPSACAAELSEDGELFDSGDDNLLSIRQILVSLKRAIKVINLTCGDNNDNKNDNSNYTEISCLRYTRTARHRVTLTFNPL
jgi:hypothetical protein